jgi:hypothetical protein
MEEANEKKKLWENTQHMYANSNAIGCFCFFVFLWFAEKLNHQKGKKKFEDFGVVLARIGSRWAPNHFDPDKKKSFSYKINDVEIASPFNAYITASWPLK